MVPLSAVTGGRHCDEVRNAVKLGDIAKPDLAAEALLHPQYQFHNVVYVKGEAAVDNGLSFLGPITLPNIELRGR